MELIKGQTEGSIDEIARLIPNIRGLLAVTSVATDEGLRTYDEILLKIITDTEGLNNAVEKQMSVLKEQIATEKGKLLPAKLAMGKAVAQLELGFLKLRNSMLEVTSTLQASFGFWGIAVSWMDKVAKKIKETIGLHKENAKEITGHRKRRGSKRIRNR